MSFKSDALFSFIFNDSSLTQFRYQEIFPIFISNFIDYLMLSFGVLISMKGNRYFSKQILCRRPHGRGQSGGFDGLVFVGDGLGVGGVVRRRRRRRGVVVVGGVGVGGVGVGAEKVEPDGRPRLQERPRRRRAAAVTQRPLRSQPSESSKTQ